MLTPWEIAKLLLIDDIWAGKLLPTMKPSEVYSMQVECSMVSYNNFVRTLVVINYGMLLQSKLILLLRKVQHLPMTGN